MHTSYIARDWLKQRGWAPHLCIPSQSEEKTQDSLTDRVDVSFGKLTTNYRGPGQQSQFDAEAQDGYYSMNGPRKRMCFPQAGKLSQQGAEQLDPRMKEKEERI